jgi:hypothetical protein
MTTYDDPIREIYVQPSSAFGATTESTQYMGPKGKVGRVRDIDVYITATMVGTTTVPEICVGTSAGDPSYARFRLGTTAIAGYAATAPFRASVIGGNTIDDGTPVYEDYTGHVKLATAVIPADTAFFISRVAGTGGVPAGTGPSRVIIDWF